MVHHPYKIRVTLLPKPINLNAYLGPRRINYPHNFFLRESYILGPWRPNSWVTIRHSEGSTRK